MNLQYINCYALNFVRTELKNSRFVQKSIPVPTRPKLPSQQSNTLLKRRHQTTLLNSQFHSQSQKSRVFSSLVPAYLDFFLLTTRWRQTAPRGFQEQLLLNRDEREPLSRVMHKERKVCFVRVATSLISREPGGIAPAAPREICIISRTRGARRKRNLAPISTPAAAARGMRVGL